MRCTHTDCATCPYPDCISSSGPKIEGSEKKKPGPKPMSPALKRERQRMSSKRYYLAHKEQFSEYYKAYNKKNADRIREKQRAYRDAKRGYSIVDPTVWITNGTKNKRVPFSKLSEYEANGWNRGRSL